MVKTLFVTSWERFLKEKKQIQRDVDAKAVVRELTQTKATEETAKELEGLTADNEKLKAYIAEQLKKGTQALQAQLAKANKKLQ